MGDGNLLDGVLSDERSWFIYVGEIKAAGLNRFLVEPLTRRYGKPASCIHIVPDVLAFYPEEIFLVVGPGSEQAGSDKTGRRNSRISPRQFAAMVAADGTVRALIDRILHIQGEVILNVFETSAELFFADDERIRVIGPDPLVAKPMNNKLLQYQMAKELGIPVPKGAVCPDMNEALDFAGDLFSRGCRAFLSEAYSAGGSHSLVASTVEEITARFQDPCAGFLVTEFMEHRHDPTVLGVIAGGNDLYIASVADQNIQGTRFMGSTFPTVLGEETVLRLKEITRTVGAYMGSRGYRGVFGCDFIVDDNDEVYFIEVNARKQGTTMETSLAMVHNLPGVPTFPELEMMAVLEGCLPNPLEEMDSRKGPLCWGTYNFKATEEFLVRDYIPPSMDEEELFRKAKKGRGGHVVLDHVGPETHIAPGGFVARVVAAGPTPDDVREGLRKGAHEVHESIGQGRSTRSETVLRR